jgi:hypothetical protein
LKLMSLSARLTAKFAGERLKKFSIVYDSFISTTAVGYNNHLRIY